VILALLFVLAMPQHSHDHAHHAAVDARGDKVMGFSHEKTRHTFRLIEDGGAIEVRAIDANDSETVAAIRSHLEDVEKDFTEGTFSKPDEIHGRMPDGAAEMKDLREEIQYKYEEITGGARVRIRTVDVRALDAVHRFLRFQITDHRTGDSTVVEKSGS
jgi:hypothetical protein